MAKGTSSTQYAKVDKSLIIRVCILVIVFQWFFCVFLLQERYHLGEASSPEMDGIPRRDSSLGSSYTGASSRTQMAESFEGVALLLILRRPRWYYKRYNVLVDNALSNIPPTWGLQIMYAKRFLFEDVLDYHRGLKRMFLSGHQNSSDTNSTSHSTESRVIWTELPTHLNRVKPNQAWKDPWVWQHVVAHRVLTVHGDGVLCANSKYDWDAFQDLDYVGVPWNLLNGVGGDGSTHSLRNRDAVIAALKYEGRTHERRNDVQLVTTLIKMNQASESSGNKPLFQLATREQTEWFGGTKNQLMNPSNGSLIKDTSYGPLVVTGTLGDLSQEARNWVIGTCPELKAIFPSLPHPSCFGARPDPVKCAAALDLPRPCNSSIADGDA